MTLSLAQTQAIAELAQHLYDYLPGSTAWKGTYAFADAAAECGWVRCGQEEVSCRRSPTC